MSESAQIKKRSVVISGHRTSISLENIFWEALRKIASREGVSVNQIVTRIDRQRSGNLSSAIRTHVLLSSMDM
jgi:predicted DNA-binding ribbon-helix-helix protein